MSKYIAFLRGINVGGHHKVPMATLREELEVIGLTNISTLLNSGNVIFESSNKSLEKIETEISKHLEKVFGFNIPVLVRNEDDIINLIEQQPFSKVNVTKDIRLYITFLKGEHHTEIKLPWSSDDHSFQILEISNNIICSVLDLSKTKTVKGMEILEKMYGKEITTRNWNTIVKLNEKVN